MIKLSNMKFGSYKISTTKGGSRFVTLKFANPMTEAQVQFFNIDDEGRRAEIVASTNSNVTFDETGIISVNPDWVTDLYQHNGQNGVYFSFEEGYKYKEYEFVPFSVARANSNIMVTAALAMDEEKSFVVEWTSATSGEHRGARFINTRVVNGELKLDAERFMDNVNALAPAFGLDPDEVASQILSGAPFTPVTAKVSAKINKSYKGDKTYLTFERIVEED